jgi:membrane-bound ClpP family serine protease
MRTGPIRSIAVGGFVVGVVVLVFGVLFLLVNQRVINVNIVFDLFTVCAIALILLGVVIIGGTVWGLRMARGGWRRWVQDWEHEGEGRGPM